MKARTFNNCLNDIFEMNELDEVESASILLATKARVCFIEHDTSDEDVCSYEDEAGSNYCAEVM